MLKLDLSSGESMCIGDDVVVTLEKKTGQVARPAFGADRSIPIRRVEPEHKRREMFGIGMQAGTR